MTFHPRYSDFYRRISSLVRDKTVGHWDGILYRYTTTKFASPKSIMSGKGAFKAGGRWNAPHTFHAVYCASSPDLANREYFAGFQTAGLPLHKAMPLTGRAFSATLLLVLDLRKPKILARIGITEGEIGKDKWREETDAGRESLCQVIGRAAHDAGLDALITPSRYALNRNDFNIVLLVENAPADSGKWKTLETR